MVKQERLAVVGQLAAGIAHDFNNILAAITLYAQLVMRASNLPANLHARMEVIVDQTSRATHLIQQILDFSRRTTITRNATALSLFLQQFVELLQHTLPETIQISLETESLVTGIDDVVDIDISRIQQVLLNLAFNARDAMPNGGELRILLSRIMADSVSPPPTSGSLTPGPWLRIDVSDTGTGIAPQDLPHLFEPFFTTKGVGAGSGLGLAQVWGIVKQHDGEIDITSEVGKGTTFSLYLSALSVAPPAPLATDTGEAPHGHGECVLVVEDNSVLAAALISTLQQLGYQVLEARNGEDAARLMAQEGNKVNLILSDLLMPLMSGEALIQSLRAQGWGQPVVVLSGHPLPESAFEQLLSQGQISWLPKPPTLAQLAAALHQALHPQSA
jgi:CheY-like chemotaxis protein